MTAPKQMLQRAVAFHQAGNVVEAERSYRSVLKQDAKHFDALHNLGLLKAQLGEFESAQALLGQAIDVDPRSLQARLSHVNVLQALNRPQDALASCEQALKLEADLPVARYMRGNLLLTLNRVEEALAEYDRVVELTPDNPAVWYNRGNVLRLLKRHDEALQSFDRALRLAPDDIEVLTNRGIALYELKRYPEALANYDHALALEPDFAEALNNRANALFELKRPEEALASCEQAVVLNPQYADAWNNRGSALYTLKRFDQALQSCNRALALEPRFVEALNNRGSVLLALKRPEAAQKNCEEALALAPDYEPAHYNLGNALQDQKKLDEAVSSYRKALALSPRHVEAHNNLGHALQAKGELDQAAASYRQALEINPDHVEAHNNLGNALHSQGRLNQAIESYKAALALNWRSADAHTNLGVVLLKEGDVDQAIAHFDQAIAIDANYSNAYNSKALALSLRGNLAEAAALFERAIALKPDFADAHTNLGGTFKDQGKLNEAVASIKRALSIEPNNVAAYTNLLFLYGFHAWLTPPQYLEAARGWETACVPDTVRREARTRTFERASLRGRRLRVGYVSGDFREHAVSYFVEQIFACHDVERIELYAYSAHTFEDQVTARLKLLAEHWTPLVGLSDAAARERIDEDKIDVLIDLSGHTAHNRLGVFARRAAPVQAHYLGYFASTGLTEMDYWLGDEIVTPPHHDEHFSERVWRLPRTWMCYRGKANSPIPIARTSHTGSVWLGTFNQLNKLTPDTIVLWAKVLHALPEGRLLVKTQQLSDPGNRDRILCAFYELGIDSNRIDLQDGRATPDWMSHMAYYDRLDIALDPVGAMGGATTTCDALWMGVPVVTLAGDRVSSRMSSSLVNAIGRPNWIAASEREYIDIVAAIAHDNELRKTSRSAQRERMTSSPLCDGLGLASLLEDAYFTMFERWLASRLAVSDE